MCRNQLYTYLPRSIQAIHEQIPEKVELLYRKYPYEVYGEPVIKKELRKKGVRYSQLEYQECYDAASDAYLYSIHQCALRDYPYVEQYIRKMVSIAINWGLVLANERRNICRMNGLREVEYPE